MNPKTQLLTFFLATLSTSFGQPAFQKACRQVLIKNKVDKPSSFDKSNKTNGHDEVILTYLGSVNATDGRIFKVLTYKYIWGTNYHTSGSIYIFDSKNKYTGQYHLGDAQDLPIKLRNGTLVFSNVDNESCDKNLVTKINLKKGLPKNIFIRCKGVYGDLYSFSSNN